MTTMPIQKIIFASLAFAFNNWQKLLEASIFPFLIAVSNGYLIGFVSREVAMIEGISVLWRLIPHGIFELPAVIFSIGIGLKIGSDLLDHQKNKKERLRINYVEGLRVFIFVVIPLLLLAGIIESVFIWLSV